MEAMNDQQNVTPEPAVGLHAQVSARTAEALSDLRHERERCMALLSEALAQDRHVRVAFLRPVLQQSMTVERTGHTIAIEDVTRRLRAFQ